MTQSGLRAPRAHHFVAWLALSLSGATLLVIVPLALATRGIALNDLAGIAIVFGLVIVGSLVLVRRPGHPLGPIFTACGTLWALSGAALAFADYALVARPQPSSVGVWAATFGSWSSDITWAVTVSFGFLLFPNGQLPSPRWRVLAVCTAGTIGLIALISLVLPGPLSQVPAIINPLGIAALAMLAPVLELAIGGFALCLLVCFLSVFVRYRAAPPSERQQIKWVAYLASLSACWYLGGELARRTSLISLENNLHGVVANLLLACFPLAIGIAILRHHLFDIDVIIRRTLVYGVLSALLALLYVGLVVVLQGLVRVLTGATQSQLATVASTLVLAALFQPLRHRIQSMIDRRFFRQKYDATAMVAALGARLRDEVALNRLSDDLVAVINDALQPTHVSLWLRPADKHAEQQAASRTVATPP